MIYKYDIFCIMIILTLFIIILYKNYYLDEPFLGLADSTLYKSNTDKINNKPLDIKSQIPVAVNQLNDQQLHNIDSNILRQNRILKNFSMTDELDVYQMYNILKQMKNKIYSFKYDVNSIDIDKKAKIIESEKLISINSGAINNVDLELFTRIKLEIISAFNNFIINSGYYINYHPYHFFKIINSNLISFNKKDINPTSTYSNTQSTITSTTKPIRKPIILNAIKQTNQNPSTTNPSTTNSSTTNPNSTNPSTTKPSTTNPNEINEYNWCMTLTIGREYKFQQFIIYYDIDMKIQNNTNYSIKLNKIEIEGIPMPNTVEFHNNKKTETHQSSNIQMELDKAKEHTENNNDYYYKDQVRSDGNESSFDIMSFGENSKLFQSQDLKFIDPIERSDMDLTFFNTNSITSKINDKIMNISKDTYFNNHKCFGLVDGVSQELPQYKTPIFCKSYHPEINQNGIWDTPCQVDKDCPFYNANKNYPNEYGKCNVDSGSCEMPLGIIPIGFTKYGKLEPNCYNCSITSKDSKCCGKQMQDIKTKKVNYASPDYIFSNDEDIRKQYTTDLEALGLSVNPSI